MMPNQIFKVLQESWNLKALFMRTILVSTSELVVVIDCAPEGRSSIDPIVPPFTLPEGRNLLAAFALKFAPVKVSAAPQLLSQQPLKNTAKLSPKRR